VRYLVTAKLNPGRAAALEEALDRGTLGKGSIAGDEYARNMEAARVRADGRVQWVEICYCPTPLLEERPYWEEYFTLEKVQDAHARSRCRDLNGTEPWACSGCDCTSRLEARLASRGAPFLLSLPDSEPGSNADHGPMPDQGLRPAHGPRTDQEPRTKA